MTIGPSDNLINWAKTQFITNDLVEKGELTENEAWWLQTGWIPATMKEK